MDRLARFAHTPTKARAEGEESVYSSPPMTTNALQFMRETLPVLFQKGTDALQGKASDGSERASKTLERVRSVSAAMHVVVDGDGDEGGALYLAAKAGELIVADAAPAGVPVTSAVGFPAAAAELVLGEAVSEGVMDDPRVAMGIAQIPNPDLEAAMAGTTTALEQHFRDGLGLVGREVSIVTNRDEQVEGTLSGLDFKQATLADGRSFPIATLRRLAAR